MELYLLKFIVIVVFAFTIILALGLILFSGKKLKLFNGIFFGLILTELGYIGLLYIKDRNLESLMTYYVGTAIASIVAGIGVYRLYVMIKGHYRG
jgi:hypothetical protein